MEAPEYPESTKMAEAAPLLTEFLQWFRTSGDLGQSDTAIICSFLGVDPGKLEAERRDMLQRLRSQS